MENHPHRREEHVLIDQSNKTRRVTPHRKEEMPLPLPLATHPAQCVQQRVRCSSPQHRYRHKHTRVEIIRKTKRNGRHEGYTQSCVCPVAIQRCQIDEFALLKWGATVITLVLCLCRYGVRTTRAHQQSSDFYVSTRVVHRLRCFAI